VPRNTLPLIAIVGPTGVGKTGLAVDLCQRFGGEVINADSRQVYRGMDIGTAKPTLEEQALAPHHLLDLFDPNERFGLGVFLPLAREVVADISAGGRLPIVAGGTGQYIWALLEGQTVPAVPPDPEFRASMEKEAAKEGGGSALHDRLRQVDPARADALDPRNVRRVVRALEIYHVSNQRPSDRIQNRPIDGDQLVIGLTMDRKTLYQRIDDRVDAMMQAGFLAEVEGLARAGYPMGQGALDCPGYRELGLHVEGELALADAVSRTKTKTHRLARRQYTWFKLSDPRIIWLDASDSVVLEQASELVSAYLAEGTLVIQ